MQKRDKFLKMFVKRGNRASWIELDKEILLIDIHNHRTYYLKGTGKLLWLMIGSNLTVQQICNKIVKRFKVEFDTVYRDISSLLKKMEKSHLILLTG
jgi:hypothetical protein